MRIEGARPTRPRRAGRGSRPIATVPAPGDRDRPGARSRGPRRPTAGRDRRGALDAHPRGLQPDDVLPVRSRQLALSQPTGDPNRAGSRLAGGAVHPALHQVGDHPAGRGSRRDPPGSVSGRDPQAVHAGNAPDERSAVTAQRPGADAMGASWRRRDRGDEARTVVHDPVHERQRIGLPVQERRTDRARTVRGDEAERFLVVGIAVVRIGIGGVGGFDPDVGLLEDMARRFREFHGNDHAPLRSDRAPAAAWIDELGRPGTGRDDHRRGRDGGAVIEPDADDAPIAQERRCRDPDADRRAKRAGERRIGVRRARRAHRDSRSRADRPRSPRRGPAPGAGPRPGRGRPATTRGMRRGAGPRDFAPRPHPESR